MVEALKAHVWPGLQLKSHLANGALHDSAALLSSQQAAAQQRPTSADPESNHESTQGSSVQTAASAAPSQAEPVATDASISEPAHANHNGHAANGATWIDVSNLIGDGPAAYAELEETSDEDEEEEAEELRTFDQMLARLSAAREQLQGLPDYQRRVRAAALAMQMLDSFGLDLDASDNE